METPGVTYEIDCDNSFKKHTGETSRKLKERMREQKDNGEKSQNDKKITGLSQHMKTTGSSPTWDDVRIILKKTTRIREMSKKQLE